MVYLTSENYKKFHYANKCSCGTLFFLMMYTITILLPFFLVFSTSKFWIPVNTDYEQALVDARNEYLIYAYQAGVTYAYSNVDSVNNLFPNQITNPSLKTTVMDNNNDGKNDIIQMNVGFTSPTTTSALTTIQVFLFFNYGFRDIINTQFQDYLLLNLQNSNGISKAYMEGTLKFKQTNPIQDSVITRKAYNSSLFEDYTQDFDLNSLLEVKFYQNETIYCDCNQAILPGGSNTDIEIQLILNIDPTQEIEYVPSILENLQNGWIQYISLFIPIYFIIDLIMGFVFKNRIFSTQEINDLPLNKIKTS